MSDKEEIAKKVWTIGNRLTGSNNDKLREIADVIDAAVAAEREACAKIADEYREEHSMVVFTLGSGPERDAELIKVDAAVEIAATIRARQPSPQENNG